MQLLYPQDGYIEVDLSPLEKALRWSNKLMQKAVIFNSNDNVATALTNLKAGEEVEINTGYKTLLITLVGAVPFGHKFSLTGIVFGSPVIKYGEVIGLATADIKPGDYVHVHNVASARGRGDLAGGEK